MHFFTTSLLSICCIQTTVFNMAFKEFIRVSLIIRWTSSNIAYE